LFFDKTAGANWKVPWHQDVSIAVRQQVEAPGFGPWSRKAGVVHVRPPVSVLQSMLTIRLHLDNCGMENGPLQVLPGSHGGGFISSEGVKTWRQNVKSVSCMVQAGGVVLMRPLLLHASSAASAPGNRRVIHLEYASGSALPAGVEWHERIDNEEPKCNPR
jgi:ectoine hydroxylase-related dioxygenase (phytanoyl-CoA dioxygenase family)